MEKVIRQAVVSVVIFFAVLFGFSRIDWMSLFNLDGLKIEERLGDMYWKVFSETEACIATDSVCAPLDTLLTHLCRTNEIDRSKIKLHVIRTEEVNAFAFPDNHLVIYSGLINECENESELCGVIAHELAHLQFGHVMHKLKKEIGLSVLLGSTVGNNGAEVMKEGIKLLSSTAYDRNMEEEADRVAVSYLICARIDPKPMADFLLRLAEKEQIVPVVSEWISTHPDTKLRSEQIMNLSDRQQKESEPILSALQWDAMKRGIR